MKGRGGEGEKGRRGEWENGASYGSPPWRGQGWVKEVDEIDDLNNMLTEEEKKEIDEETRLYPYRSAACIDALKIVQKHRGWISDEAVAEIAGELGMSVEDTDGIATFYTRIYRKPVGRNVILICDSISCMIMGYQSVYEYISKKLSVRFGETTKDGRFTLLPITCLGDCDHAPALMVNNDHYNDLTIEKVDNILDKYL